MSALCREAAGTWWNVEECRMDAAPGARCRFHRPGLAGALGCALYAGVLDPISSRIVDGAATPSHAEREAVERLVAVGRLWRPGASHKYPPPEVHELATRIRLYAVTLHLLWDVASRPGTDTSERLATLLRGRLTDLADDLGAFLAGAIHAAMYKPYLETSGNLDPFPTRRHADECQQPYDADTGKATCDCPVFLDWEWNEQQAARDGEPA